MGVIISQTPELLGIKAAERAGELLKKAIEEKNSARLLLSTGASQFETLKNLAMQDVDWSKVEMFHLDEYIGIDDSHIASFVKYLKERFVNILPSPLKATHFLSGKDDPEKIIADLTSEIRKAPIDVALIGIGENAHIAFNDPPADFDTKEAFKVVYLDEDCKKQQVREGWFPTIEDVPKTAITMTVHQIMMSKIILSAVPYSQKADAVKKTLDNDLTNLVPATMLKSHADWTLYLDSDSASLIDKEPQNNNLSI